MYSGYARPKRPSPEAIRRRIPRRSTASNHESPDEQNGDSNETSNDKFPEGESMNSAQSSTYSPSKTMSSPRYMAGTISRPGSHHEEQSTLNQSAAYTDSSRVSLDSTNKTTSETTLDSNGITATSEAKSIENHIKEPLPSAGSTNSHLPSIQLSTTDTGPTSTEPPTRKQVTLAAPRSPVHVRRPPAPSNADMTSILKIQSLLSTISSLPPPKPSTKAGDFTPSSAPTTSITNTTTTSTNNALLSASGTRHSRTSSLPGIPNVSFETLAKDVKPRESRQACTPLRPAPKSESSQYNATAPTPKAHNRATYTQSPTYPTQKPTLSHTANGASVDTAGIPYVNPQIDQQITPESQKDYIVSLFHSEVDATCITYQSHILLQSCKRKLDEDDTHDMQSQAVACLPALIPKKESTSKHLTSKSLTRTMETKYTATATGSGIPHMKQQGESNLCHHLHVGVTEYTLQIVHVKPLSWFANTHVHTSSPTHYLPSHIAKHQPHFFFNNTGTTSQILSPFEVANDCRVVRYGDIVALISPTARNRALGVRATKSESLTTSSREEPEELGFHRSGLGDKEKWLVLPTANSIPNNDGNVKDANWNHKESIDAVRIGIKVRDMESLLLNEAQGTLGEHSKLYESMSGRMYGRPVRGDAGVALMNLKSGGLLYLAIKDNTETSMLQLDTRGHGMLNTLLIQQDTHGWRFVQANTPPCPRTSSIYMQATNLMYSNRHGDDDNIHQQSLGSFSVPQQESILLKELLSAMMANEGTFLRFSPAANNIDITDKDYVWAMGEFQFTLEEWNSVDPNLYNTLQKILPMCTAHACIQEFTSTRMASLEYGLVAQAMASAITVLLQTEYLPFVCQMENLYQQGRLTISQLWSHIQPYMTTLKRLLRITQCARYFKGGQLLKQVYQLALHEFDGEERARQLVLRILQDSSQPYMDMLHSWIYEGSVYDPYGEFLVTCTNLAAIMPSRTSHGSASMTSALWDECYQIQKQNVFLMADDIAIKVLRTGKYLYVIRECSSQRYETLVTQHKTNKPQLQVSNLTTGSLTLSEHIVYACSVAERTLLNLIWEDFCLMECLHFVRRFFLMDQGDFFVQFLDLTEHELLLPVKKVSKGRIQSLLGLAIQLSSSNQTIERDRQRNTEDVSFDSETEPKRALFHSDLVCKFEHDHFIDRLDAIHKKSGGIVNSNATSSTFPRTPSRHAYGMVGGPNGEGGGLRGIEALTLDCKVDFPLSLILSREVMTSYQLLFRHLFFSKYVERRLFGTWLDHQMLKGLNLRAYMGKTYLLRQRMLHFMQNFVYYMMFEVIEPHWIDLIKQLNNADTVDGLMQVHKSFQADILQECLLTNTELLSVLAKLMTTCLNFSDQMRLFAAKTRIVSSNT